MGNTSSSSGRGTHDDSVDFGSLHPQGVYTGTPDWNHQIVTQLIADRKLAPFYRPLEDYEDDWDEAQILAARKSPPQPDASSSASNVVDGSQGGGSTPSRVDSRDGSKHSASRRANPAQKDRDAHPQCLEAAVYRGAVECPICFLYYPANINRSRCCDQVICTECFVQIKRAEPTATHLVSEPAACPYCVQDNFGVVYSPPVWRTGLGSEGAPLPPWAEGAKDVRPAQQPKSRRRKSFSADAPEVVTIDHIRPDWEAKLNSVRAAVARRANRRIIMRQVGDRLIPVGVTSGRVHPISGQSSHGHSLPGGGALAHFLGGGGVSSSQDDNHDGEGEGRERERERGSRRFRRHRERDLSQMLGQMGLGGMAGQDLEELMVMEAMRLSLVEHEEQQRKEEEKRKKDAAEAAARGEGAGEESVAASTGALSISGTSAAATSSTPTPTSGSGSSTDVAAEGSPVPSPEPQSSSQPSAPEVASAAPITLAGSQPATSSSSLSSASSLSSLSTPPPASTETTTVTTTTDAPAPAPTDMPVVDVPSEVALATADASAPQDGFAHEPHGFEENGETDTESAVTANEEVHPPIATLGEEPASGPGPQAAVEPPKHAPAAGVLMPAAESANEGAGSA
ncbi:hypothetical protein CONPUDRAFT_162276 [Coniophora puteana RWD-64-598 SS2]|uniref:RING-type domain-containing protein n=1 Tax=Coniophora puteana (strain RWD-64-598) TaxID=741705 RepID=A0A5M3N124_CONPW|nr:uncharacterized protein CONPUDRAFT_162276 [Coniophora puteana RWD-64-598 SS2]EIW84967.1 hypothetical protein CONPUDRAFT_162276 [Coniophora puteana RWD-64-598 SS2]